MLGATGCGSSPSTASRTLLDFDATSNVKTENFQTHGRWDVAYSWDCGQVRSQGNLAAAGLKVVVYNSDDDSTAAESNPEFTGKGLSGQGTVHYRNPGLYYFQITTVCKYRIRVLSVA
jgi:hypothetical protein